jgi:hypothetical protein
MGTRFLNAGAREMEATRQIGDSLILLAEPRSNARHRQIVERDAMQGEAERKHMPRQSDPIGIDPLLAKCKDAAQKLKSHLCTGTRFC